MTIEIGLLVALVAGIIGFATFFLGRQSAAKNDGERWGKLEATLQHMQDDLREIKNTMAENAKSTKESLRRVHDRIDNHLREQHSMEIPKRQE